MFRAPRLARVLLSPRFRDESLGWVYVPQYTRCHRRRRRRLLYAHTTAEAAAAAAADVAAIIVMRRERISAYIACNVFL